MKKILKELVKSLPLGAALPLVIMGASIGPDDAIKHLTQWVSILGINAYPPFLEASLVRQLVFWGACLLFALYAIKIWLVPIAKKLTARKVDAASEEKGIEYAKLDVPEIGLRHQEIVLGQRTTAIELYEMAKDQETMVVHYLSGMDERTRLHADELCSILRSLMHPKSEKPVGPRDEDEICAQIKKKMVYLKGNDVLIYADKEFKWLPERDSLPTVPDPMIAEFQLIIAFKRREEYEDNLAVTVQFDAGQPTLHTHGFKPKK